MKILQHRHNSEVWRKKRKISLDFFHRKKIDDLFEYFFIANPFWFDRIGVPKHTAQKNSHKGHDSKHSNAEENDTVERFREIFVTSD